MSDGLEEHIIELQTKLQFQEDAIAKLDEVIIQQGELLHRMTLRIEQLEDKLEQVRYEKSERPAEEERPPHY